MTSPYNHISSTFEFLLHQLMALDVFLLGNSTFFFTPRAILMLLFQLREFVPSKSIPPKGVATFSFTRILVWILRATSSLFLSDIIISCHLISKIKTCVFFFENSRALETLRNINESFKFPAVNKVSKTHTFV